MEFYFNFSFLIPPPAEVFSLKGFCYESDIIARYLLNIIFGSLSFLIIWGNILLITTIIYFKQLHTPTNFLILSLSVTDLFVGILILPLGVIPVWRSFCMIIVSTELGLCSCSVLNLCFISVDRYFAVCQPLKYRTKITFRVTVIMILVSWTLSCICYFSINAQALFVFFLPSIMMCVIYLKILTVAQRQARSIQNTTCHSTKSESKMERKATKTLAIVMGLFLISWTPFFICWTLHCTGMINISMRTIFLFMFIGWLNSMLNPFIYGFFYSWFRSAFRMIITGKIFQGDFTNSKLS